MPANVRGDVLPQKKLYEAPHLVLFGSLSDLTAGGSPDTTMEPPANGAQGVGVPGLMKRARASY